MPIKFTNAALKKLAVQPGKKDRVVFSSDVPSLGLRIGARAKTFLFQSRTASGRIYRKPLGKFGDLTIEAATRLARIEGGKIAEGHDPLAARQSALKIAKSDYTVERLSEDWKANARLKDGGALSLTYKRKVELRFVGKDGVSGGFGALIKKAAASVTEKDLEAAIEKIAAPAAKRNFVASMKALFKWAKARKKIAVNPAAAIELPPGGGSRKHTPTLEEMQRIFRTAEVLGPSYRGAARYLQLTLVRRNEAGGSRWSEIDMGERRHLIPGSRMKARLDHVVPLSDVALDPLDTTPRLYGSDLVFPGEGGKPIS
jgi:integrase